ncbi:putative reverse transcriptase domain-containing protein [Tanacetum coccineum]
MPSECLNIIEDKSKVRQTRDKAVLPRVDECLALADLTVASINLMPFSVGIKAFTSWILLSTGMTLETADRSISKLNGIGKRHLVKSGVFHFSRRFCGKIRSHKGAKVPQRAPTLENFPDIQGYQPEFFPWVSPIHCVPKKGGMTVVVNEENELIPTRLVTGWRRGMKYYCFSMVSPVMQIPIDPVIKKTTFTCPHKGTFAYRRMPFGLCNAPGTFQRCMLAIFHDMVEKTMEVFMDDFSVFGNSFQNCLSRLDHMLQRCEDTNLSLNWEKSHFMVKEGIVLAIRFLRKGIEVDKAKSILAQPGYEQWVRQKDAMVGANGGNQFRHSDQGVRTVGTQNGQIVVLELLIESQMGMEMLGWGSSCLELYKSDQGRRDGYLDENWGMSICKCILMANLQQASTSGTQTDKAPVYDSDGSVECGKEGGTVDQHLATVEETVLYFESNFILILALDRLKRSTEAAKFVRDFKSLAKEADESLAKHKTLELEIECLLTSSVDITTKTRRPQPRSNIKNDRVPSASKSSCIRIKKLKSRKKQIRASHPPKPVPNSKQRLHLLHMDLCGPMRIASINGKRYVLVIVDDYSRYTWVDPRETSLRDDAIIRGSDEPHLEQDSDPEIQAEIDECFAYADALRDIGIEADDRDETETGVRGPVKVRVERVTHPAMPKDIPEPAQEGAVEATYEILGDLVQRFHDHTQVIPVHRIHAIEGVQREQGHRIVGVESAVIALTERIAELERDNMRLRGTASVESQRVDRLQRGMSRMQREKMPNTRSGASMTREEFEELVNHRVAEEMEAREAARTLEPLNEDVDEQEGENGGYGNRGNGGNGNGGNGENGNGNRNGNHGINYGGFMPVARECTFQDFLKCKPHNFSGAEGVVGLTRWFEKMEIVFNISNCSSKYQVKYASCTLQDSALTWWNSRKRTIGVEAAYAMNWVGLMKLMTKELILLCTRMVPDEGDIVERFIRGLPDNIQGNVIDANPARLQDDIRIANPLMDKKVQGYASRSAENKRRMESNLRDNRGQQPPFKRQNTSGQNVARAYTAGNNERKGYAGPLPYCNKCRLHHEGLCTMRCGNCKKVGHQTRDCRAAIAPNTQRAPVGNQQGIICYECGRPGHFKKILNDFIKI